MRGFVARTCNVQNVRCLRAKHWPLAARYFARHRNRNRLRAPVLKQLIAAIVRYGSGCLFVACWDSAVALAIDQISFG